MIDYSTEREPDWKALEQIPEFTVLKKTLQKPSFHGEGDVWTHTQMALNALLQDAQWQQLPKGLKKTVYLATLMHDIGKGATTKKDSNGEWTSPKHGPVGARIARTLLWKKIFGDISFKQREQITALIEFHGMPLWAHDREHIEHELRVVSQLVSMHAFALLSKADVLGRVAKDRKDLLQRVEFFEQLAKEAECFEQPYVFPNEYARWSYATRRHSDIHYTPYDESWGEVIVLCGVPGSGKDTWIQQHASAQPIVSLDDIREELGIDPSNKNQGAVVQLAFQRAKALLAKHKSFIWNATNVREQRRRELIDLFSEYGARVKLVYIEAEYEELWSRNRTREKPVPNHVLQRMIANLDVPKPYEAACVEYYDF